MLGRAYLPTMELLPINLANIFTERSRMNTEATLVVREQPPFKRLADYKLIAFDMDSTLINIECIDEIADMLGKKDEVAAITEATMQGNS